MITPNLNLKQIKNKLYIHYYTTHKTILKIKIKKRIRTRRLP